MVTGLCGCIASLRVVEILTAESGQQVIVEMLTGKPPYADLMSMGE